MHYLGDYPVNGTVTLKWSSQAATGASITRATDGSIRIYKGTSTSERASSAGITDTEDFDSVTGVHLLSIDLSNNADAGFYAAGNEYQIVLFGATIDGQSVNAVLAHFSIERAGGALALLKAAGITAGRINADITAIATNTDAATNLSGSARSIYVGSVTGAVTTTTLIDAGLTQTDTDFWVGRIVIFITGTQAKQATRITGFDATNDKLTFDSLTAAPSGGDAYVIV